MSVNVIFKAAIRCWQRRIFVAAALTMMASAAAAQIPTEFQGLWTNEKDNCDGEFSDGITVLGVTKWEVSWYEIVCAPVEVLQSGRTLRLKTNCEKGGGYRYTATIMLEHTSAGKMRFSIGEESPETMWACPAKYQRTLARNAHPSSGTYFHNTTVWNHNGSKMALEVGGELRRFIYVEPRPGMQEAGAAKGDVVFNGRAVGSRYWGIAYVFNRRCGTYPYRVEGTASSDHRTVLLQGKAPRVNARCRITGQINDRLEFNLTDETIERP